MWALRGLRNGVLTTRWPARPDPYAAATRGPATVLAGPHEGESGPVTVLAGRDAAGSGADLARLCPAGAISTASQATLTMLIPSPKADTPRPASSLRACALPSTPRYAAGIT